MLPKPKGSLNKYQILDSAEKRTPLPDEGAMDSVQDFFPSIHLSTVQTHRAYVSFVLDMIKI